uniref:Transmembrane protein 127 transmembrane region domain-containing protein n=1 Tax=Plectus sambesii TaxID=2011161 RepID=A0A914V2K4_9BILA
MASTSQGDRQLLDDAQNGHVFQSAWIQRVLRNKHIVVIGDSVQRGVYKDLVCALQFDRLLDQDTELKLKGEESFLNDRLVFRTELTNGTNFEEVREYQSEHCTHLVQFYFTTRCYNYTIETMLREFAKEPPDVVLMNSCLWDISRYEKDNATAELMYRKRLTMLLDKMRQVLPPTSQFIWLCTPPVASKIGGGFLLKEIQFMEESMRVAILEANYYCAQIVASYGFDVLDLHYYLRAVVKYRSEKDGVHWNPIAHRHITDLIIAFLHDSWGISLPQEAVDKFKITNLMLDLKHFNHAGIPDFVEPMVASLGEIADHRRPNEPERSMWLGWIVFLALLDDATSLLDVCGRGAKSIDSAPILSIRVRNSTDSPADESFRETICANTSTSTVTISYSTQFGLSVTTAFDFRKELRLWRVTTLGEQDVLSPAASIFCFVDRFSPEEVLGATSISSLRQKKNVAKVKDADEWLAAVSRQLDVRIRPELLGRLFGGGIEKFCADTDGVLIGSDDLQLASPPAIDLTGDDDDAQWLEPRQSNLSALRQCASMTRDVPTANEWSFAQRRRCSCVLPVCIPWLPCGWKLCKSEAAAGLSSSTYKCGVKSCRPCALFRFEVFFRRSAIDQLVSPKPQAALVNCPPSCTLLFNWLAACVGHQPQMRAVTCAPSSSPTRRRHIFCGCKRSERNATAACMSLLSALLVACALADDQWMTMTGGRCLLPYLGTPLFCQAATFTELKRDMKHSHIVYKYGGHNYQDCVTPAIANVFYGLIGLCFVTLSTAFGAFVLNAVGPRRGFFKWLRRNTILEVCTVILCVAVVSVTYVVSTMVEQLQRDTANDPAAVEVRFSQGFFLIVSSGFAAIAATATSLFSTLRATQRKRKDKRNLITTHPLRSSATQRPQASSPVATVESGGKDNPLAIFEQYLDAVADPPSSDDDDVCSTTDMDVALVPTGDKRAQP